MFTVYHSNQIDLLKTLLIELVKRDPLDNPFSAENILVQSPGMSQWLKMSLAEELGIAANIEFSLPASFIWDQFVEVLGDIPKQSAFSKESLTWKIMHLLPSHLKNEVFAPLTQYLQDDEDGAKCYQLAEKIADIFDGYLVYRPEWILAWESGEQVAELGDEQLWQSTLWQSIYDHTLALGQSPYHRANLYQDFIDTLEHSALPESVQLPKRLFVFGISSLPPRYLDALKALGQHIDVHLMFTNPCQFYWGEVRDRKYLAHLALKKRKQLTDLALPEDDNQLPLVEQLKGDIEQNIDDELHISQVGNGLLASMGKLGRDNLYLLSQMEANEIVAFAEVERNSLLRHIQADVLNLEEHQNDHVLDNSNHKLTIERDDRSLSVHVCHSPMREVEVLHDRLLEMFAADPNLKPRDVIVMVADINTYSPAISAVFGNASDERYIPFSISDRTADKESPLLNAFNQLLMLPESRCSNSELLSLLEVPAVLAKFDLTEHEFSVIKEWVEEAHIRWGLNADTATEFELPSLEQNSWVFGLSRMLAGYAMTQELGLLTTEESVIAPYEQTQGMQAETVGKLAQYIDTVIQYRSKLNQVVDVEQWQQIINQLLVDFFAVELEGEVVVKSIQDTVAGLKTQLQQAQFSQPLSPTIIRDYFANKLSGVRVSQRFLAGQVNFCTLMPMRSIPFKTVCLLGMNDGVYPRSIAPESFDLMTGRNRAGDRSRRDDDRYLFLEAMLSAQESLYISYVGRSIQDNSEKVPSVLVSELIEYCQQNYCLSADKHLDVDASASKLIQHLVSDYPMVPFSANNYLVVDEAQHEPNYSSYASEWLATAERQAQNTPPTAANNVIFKLPPIVYSQHEVELELTELQRFWRLPVQYLFNRRLQVNFDQQSFAIEEDEPFALNNLESFKLRQALLQAIVKSPAEELTHLIAEFTQQQKAQGQLPVGSFGDLELAGNISQTTELAEMIRPLTANEQPDIEVIFNTSINGIDVKLQGWVKQVYGSGLVRYRSGRLRGQDYLSAWIEHLLVAVSGSSRATHLLAYDKKEGVVHRVLPKIDAETAKQHLTKLLEYYFSGLDQPLAYFPETAMDGVQANMVKGQWTPNQEKMLSKMATRFNGGYNMTGEGANLYIARVWSQWNDELAQESMRMTQWVLEPAVTYSVTREDYYSAGQS
ncbi:exodeoxyribonuclease V subunit gamma [Vibrio hippocampi]|uniref:RecBCD enzyme subunit RecC n=1 Tax=Vibrio hippocampi TaxID=654686 RepID=A0ABN8DJH1_9VIBR|nr:exodeoxyribonuclease V subunit gamma [Vibrio hippocampi]CAH0526742.1 RecBCD enzyme subunit RecC [Vibrio hippocampi]